MRTLRHYDEIGLLRPAQVNPVTGYRGYLASQLGQLNRILALKELAPALGPANIVPVVNRLAGQFDQLGIGERVKEAGPRMLFYEYEHGEDVTVYLALPAAEPPGELPAPAQYRVLPEIEAAVTVRSGPAASIFPVVYHDLIRWIDERGYRAAGGPGREVWVHEGSGRHRRRGSAGVRDPAALHPPRHPGRELAMQGPADGAQGRTPDDRRVAPRRRTSWRGRTSGLAVGLTMDW